ncbi:hypothetical protein DFAR_3180031 [Desulfarculales bacterium]
MLEKRSIANQVLSSVAYYPKWPTSRGADGPYSMKWVPTCLGIGGSHRVESPARFKRNPH